MSENHFCEAKARALLHELGIPLHHRSYWIIIVALRCIAKDETSLTALIKGICIPVSEKTNCSCATVEASIRRASELAWNNNPELMQAISTQPLQKRPTVRQFLDNLYYSSLQDN